MTTSVLSVIIPTRGRFEPLLDSLCDLLKQDYASFEVIVVDQNDAWPVALEARRVELCADPRVIWVARFPVGVVGARNHAVSLSRGELLVFVDDDVSIPDRDFLTRHADCYRSADVDCVCGRELKTYDLDQASGMPKVPASDGPTHSGANGASPLRRMLQFDRSSAVPAEVPVFSTCNGSVRREAFLRIGGFDESFRGASYGDDADFVLRLAANGGRIIYRPEPWLVHLLAPLGGLRAADQNNPFSPRDRSLSGLIFLLRHARGPDFAVVLNGWVLRRTVLLRQNVIKPWRQPAAIWGLLSAVPDAVRCVRRGPSSRFSSDAAAPTPIKGSS